MEKEHFAFHSLGVGYICQCQSAVQNKKENSEYALKVSVNYQAPDAAKSSVSSSLSMAELV